MHANIHATPEAIWGTHEAEQELVRLREEDAAWALRA